MSKWFWYTLPWAALCAFLVWYGIQLAFSVGTTAFLIILISAYYWGLVKLNEE